MDVNNSELLAQVEYDVKSEEEAVSFSEYQKKYTTKGKIIKSVLFVAVGLLFLYQVLMDRDYTLGWGLMGVSFAVAIYIWINPIVIRKNLLKALKQIEGDKYCFELYDKYFSIETIQLANSEEIPSENENTDTSDENSSEEEENPASKIPPKIVKFDEEAVDFVEKENVFVIFLRKQTYYTIPKRCMDENTSETIKNFFRNK